MTIASGFLFVLFLLWVYSIIRVVNAVNEFERSLKELVRGGGRPRPLDEQRRRAWEERP
jgi:hypothetical protein